MIELNRSKNHGIGKVVQELRAFVEKGRIVFVPFDDEVLPRFQLKAAAEIFRNPADQKRRLKTCELEDPREH